MKNRSGRRPIRAAVQPSPPGIKRRSLLKSVVIGGVAFAAGSMFLNFKARARKRRLPISIAGTHFRCARGPWGNLECERIVLEPVAQIFSADRFSPPTRWFFKGYDEKQTRSFLLSIGVSKTELADVSDQAWTEEKEGIVFMPPTQFVKDLSPDTRRKLYDTLITWPQYLRYFDNFSFFPEYFDATLQQTGLTDETLSLFRRLTYPREQMLTFSDLPLVLSTLPNDADKLRFLQMIVRRPSLRIKLNIDSSADVTALANYWGKGGREQAVRKLIESSIQGGKTSQVNIIDLMPQLVRVHAQRFPSPIAPAELIQNCHWTALNFFRDPPDPAFLYADQVENEMSRNYVQIKSQPQLGDLILFRGESHVILHSATFIADDIIFTKNGEGLSQPWSFMRVEDTTNCYSALAGKVSVTLYRPQNIG